MQRRISIEAATELKGKLTSQQEQALAQPASQSAEAYELYLRGKAAMKQDKASNELAFNLFQRALKLDPNMAEAYAGIGSTQWRSYYFGWGGDIKTIGEAERSFRRALDLNPTSAAAFDGLATVYLSQDKSEECLKLARQLGALGLDDAEHLSARADAYYLGGLADKAIPLLLRAIELDPANRSSYSQLVSAYGDTRDYRKSAEAGELVLRKFGDRARTHFQTAISYHNLGDFERAKAHYEQAIKLAPDEFPAYRFLGILYRQNGQAEKAKETWLRGIEMLKPAIDAAPENFRLQYILLRFYATLGDRRAALNEEARLLRETPPNGLLFVCLAHTHAYFGEVDRAVEYLRKAFAARFIELEVVKSDGLEQLQASPAYQQFLKEYNERLNQFRSEY